MSRWYIDEFRETAKWGRTKQTTLEFLEGHEIGETDVLLLTVPVLIHHIRSRRLGGQSGTASNDLTWIHTVMRAAQSVRVLPVKSEIVEQARSAWHELAANRKEPSSQRTDYLGGNRVAPAGGAD